MAKTRKPHKKPAGGFVKPWTPEALKHVVNEWSNVDHTDVLAKDLGMSYGRVTVMARRLRYKGFSLPRRKHHGKIDRMIRELAEE